MPFKPKKKSKAPVPEIQEPKEKVPVKDRKKWEAQFKAKYNRDPVSTEELERFIWGHTRP